MQLTAAVARGLADGGVHHAFGVVGGGNILAVAALAGLGVEYLAARNEAGAVTMADAYHRATGRVAVCTTTHGAGLTNTATGLAEAVRHGSGMVLLCGDRPRSGLRRCDVDQAAFAASLGAEAVRVTAPETAEAAARAALTRARDLSRPVVLCLPADLLGAEVPDPVTDPGRAELVARVEPARSVPDESDLEDVLDLVAAARRPLVLAGLGAWRSGAAAGLTALADRLGGLLSTTVMANGLFSGNPWSLGICGGFASPAAAALIGEADLVLAFGAGLDPFTLHGGRMFARGAPVVRVDTAAPPAPAAPLVPPVRELTGDATATAVALIDGIDARDLPPTEWRVRTGSRVGRTRWGAHPVVDESTSDRIDPRLLTAALAEALPAERTVVLDGGHFVGWPSMYLAVPDPAAMVFTGAAFQAVGQGFAGAVGAAVGRPDRLTVAALGDGGALMGLSELETLVRCGRSVLVVVYDDAAYGFEVHTYGPRGATAESTSFGADTDFAGVARALGARAATVRGRADLVALDRWNADGRPGVLLLDCKIVPEVVAPYLADMLSGSH